MKPLTLLVAAFAGFVQSSSVPANHSHSRSDRCLGELGCFPITDDFFHPIWRVINVPVDPRETINTKFMFHTRKNIYTPDIVAGYNVEGKVLDTVHFNRSLETKIVVHGFLDTQFFGEWMALLKTELLIHGDYNVIIVDWMGGNGLPYTQATANTRVVGAEIALLVKKLQARFHIDLDSVHIYGHSLGAHIAGYAGAGLGGKIARITAMDAAEPFFQHLPISVRLDTTDAEFVETIHTDARSFVTSLGLGFSEPLGHLDFYPNGGEQMPGCELLGRLRDFKETGLRGLTKVGACDHVMSTIYAGSFLNRKNACIPVAFSCKNYDLFKSGHCYDCGADGSKCAPANYDSMAYYKRFANSTNNERMFFATAASGPNYCLFHYNLAIKMRRTMRDKPRKVAPEVDGTYHIKIEGAKKTEEFTIKTSLTSMHPGSMNRALISTSSELGEIRGVTFRYVSNRLLFPPAMELDYVKITPMNVAMPRASLRVLTLRVCPATPLASRKNTALSAEYCSRN